MRLRIYTVHVSSRRGPDEAELVKEGFCWPALFFGPIWAAWHGMWLLATGLLAAAIGLSLVADLWPSADLPITIAGVAFDVLVAAEANDLRRRHLARHGWRKAAVIGGPGIDTAHRRYLDLSALSST